jgi:hypothetical protein
MDALDKRPVYSSSKPTLEKAAQRMLQGAGSA